MASHARIAALEVAIVSSLQWRRNPRSNGNAGMMAILSCRVNRSRAQFLHSIESRIDRMEALLESSKLVPPQSAAEPEPEPEPEPSPKASTDGLEKELANLVINKSGEQKYIGESHPKSPSAILERY